MSFIAKSLASEKEAKQRHPNTYFQSTFRAYATAAFFLVHAYLISTGIGILGR